MSFYCAVKIGSLLTEGNIFLAPVAGYTDRAFRSVCIEQGADFTYTELVSSEALVRNKSGTDVLLRRAHNENNYCIQLFGSDPDVMYKAASLLAGYNPSAIDINSGCPVPKVVKTGAGSALMKNPSNLGRIVSAVARASNEYLGGIPVTVKIRSGWDENSINYYECARIAVSEGAVMIGLHARTRAQGYEGKSNWTHIKDLAEKLDVPVAGSGDLFTPESALDMLRETRCAAVMLARGAMGNPFIFSATRSLLLTGSYSLPDYAERLKTGLNQLKLMSEDIGERKACCEMRKQFCAYTRGMKGGAELRNLLVSASAISDYEKLLLPIINEGKNNDTT